MTYIHIYFTFKYMTSKKNQVFLQIKIKKPSTQAQLNLKFNTFRIVGNKL